MERIMRDDLTDITLVIDRSGSMESIKDDAAGGINEFINQQASESGEALLTLMQFDDKYELVHSGINVKKVPRYELVPRGMTALLDAVGRAINETGERLAAINEPDRPGLVVVVIVTDGAENASKEYTRADIRRMIEHQQSIYNWQFTFLAANQDAFAAGGSLGIDASGIANFAAGKMQGTYAATNAKVARMRRAAMNSEAIDNAFTVKIRVRGGGSTNHHALIANRCMQCTSISLRAHTYSLNAHTFCGTRNPNSYLTPIRN